MNNSTIVLLVFILNAFISMYGVITEDKYLISCIIAMTYYIVKTIEEK